MEKHKNKLQFEKMWEAADVGVLGADVGLHSIISVLPKISSFADKHYLHFSEGRFLSTYYEKEQMKRAAEAGYQDFTNQKYLEEYFSTIKDLLLENENFIQGIAEKEMASLSDAELREIDAMIGDLNTRLFGYYHSSQPQCVSKLEAELKKEIAKTAPQEKQAELFSLLSTPTMRSLIQEEEIAWLKLVDSSQDDEALEHHRQRYFILGTGDGHEPSSLEDLKNRKQDDLKSGNIREKLDKLENAQEELQKEQQSSVERYQLSDEAQSLARTLGMIAHWRFEIRLRGWMPLIFYGNSNLEEMGKRRGYALKHMLNMRLDELIRFEKDEEISKEELEIRDEAFCIGIIDGKRFFFSGAEAKRKFEELVTQTSFENTETLKGSIARSGVATGPVLKVRWGEDVQEALAKAPKDFILVAGQTRPQLMPLIRKAVAIVTDEGGITSHAAIVSRELGIPCIIGTKHATDVLENGDTIEVDAHKGEVRRIS